MQFLLHVIERTLNLQADLYVNILITQTIIENLLFWESLKANIIS